MDRVVSAESPDPLTRPSPQEGAGDCPHASAERSEEPTIVVAAVIERNGLILIARRPAALHLGGLWEFPGGKQNANESPEAALAREIAEELGVRVTVGPLLERVDWSYPEKRVRLSFFRCAIEGEARPLEGQELAWVRPADLRRYEFPPADATLLDRLSRG